MNRWTAGYVRCKGQDLCAAYAAYTVVEEGKAPVARILSGLKP
jgi:hypothetical protein